VKERQTTGGVRAFVLKPENRRKRNGRRRSKSPGREGGKRRQKQWLTFVSLSWVLEDRIGHLVNHQREKKGFSF
jgi:hypothetical protein